MPDNTNVNNNASVVVVGRTAPVPPGQQKSDKSVPVVIASDQSTIPVAEQNKVQSEVALSLLGIPRSEVALGIFADVNTYDVNPTEWAAEPEAFSKITKEDFPEYGTDGGDGTEIEQDMGWGLTHIPEESGALVEAPADRTAVLTSKRFFRYQPGRVSAATFGVKTTIMDPRQTDKEYDGIAPTDTQDIGSSVHNPVIRKYGIFDNFDGYYWETRNNGQGDNFCVVRRTQSLLFNNPVDFSATTSPGQTQDFGATNPLDITAPRGNETNDGLDIPNTSDNAFVGFPIGGADRYPDGHDSTPSGYKNVRLGNLIIYRDNLMMTHAGVYDPSILQEEQSYTFGTDVDADIGGGAYGTLDFDISNSSNNSGLGRSISNAEYDINTGIMTVTTYGNHGFQAGKFVTLAGIGMHCLYSYSNHDGTGSLVDSLIKTYPDRTHGYNIINVNDDDKFEVNVGVSTVKTFFNQTKSESNYARVIGLSTNQYVKYSKGDQTNAIENLTDGKIYRINQLGYDNSGTKEVVRIQLKELTTKMSVDNLDNGAMGVYDPGKRQTAATIDLSASGAQDKSASTTGHRLITPVPFVQPVANDIIRSENETVGRNIYGTADVKHSGMFPYMYKESETAGAAEVGYVDTTLDEQAGNVSKLKNQITALNLYYRDWINQNVKKEFWNVYEYRVPRSRFSGDRLDNVTDNLLFSDVTAENRAGTIVRDSANAPVTDTSIWSLEFDKVTMYKVEFSWYGAVGALFLAYVPVGNGEARWVRVHHLRASNQLKGSSLGNATLPITYMIYGGGGPNRYGILNSKRTNTLFGYGSSSEHIVKYGASYYIDGGDRGTVKLFSHGTQTAQPIFGSKRQFTVGDEDDKVSVTNASNSNTTDPYLTFGNNVVGFSSSYYVGAKVVTTNPLDQNVEVVYVDIDNKRLHLNTTLAQPLPSDDSTIEIIANRPTPLIGLKCRDFITSSQGKEVRNRTQVYPTRLSTGSEGSVIKVDLLKTPVFQTTSTVDTTDLSLTSDINIGKRGEPTLLEIDGSTIVSNSGYLNTGTGVYGYMRGKFEGDDSDKIFTFLGYLENRGGQYYFNALESTSQNVLLSSGIKFLYEGSAESSEPHLSPTGKSVSYSNSDFTLDPLSSIKVSPEIRAPIPKTGIVVSSLFIPASGEEFDLSTYFDYNKEYLSFPLTNVVESLYIVGSSDKDVFSSGTDSQSTTSVSVTWEEQ